PVKGVSAHSKPFGGPQFVSTAPLKHLNDQALLYFPHYEGMDSFHVVVHKVFYQHVNRVSDIGLEHRLGFAGSPGLLLHFRFEGLVSFFRCHEIAAFPKNFSTRCISTSGSSWVRAVRRNSAPSANPFE